MDWDELRRLAESLSGRGLVEEMNRQRDLLSGAALSRQVLDDLAAGALAQRLPSESLVTIAEQVVRARQPWLELSGRAGSLPELNGAAELARTLDTRLRSSREQLEAQVATFQWLAVGLGGADGPQRLHLANVEPAGALALFKASESLFGSFRTLVEEVASVDAAGVESAILDLPPLRVASQHGLSRRRSWEPSDRGGGDEVPDEGVVAELLELELTGRLEEELPARLAAVDPELPRLWAGARQALRSHNADRVRHASVSVRELVDHTLRRLAPDEKIAAWSQEPKLKHRDRYTRAARLDFLARDVRSGAFADFTKKSHRAALAAVDLFQAGTHSLEEPFEDHDAEHLILVVGAHLLLILPRRAE